MAAHGTGLGASCANAGWPQRAACRAEPSSCSVQAGERCQQLVHERMQAYVTLTYTCVCQPKARTIHGHHDCPVPRGVEAAAHLARRRRLARARHARNSDDDTPVGSRRARRARAVAQPAFKQVLAAFNRRWKLLTPLTKVGETGQDHQVQLWHLCSSQRDIRP